MKKVVMAMASVLIVGFTQVNAQSSFLDNNLIKYD